MRDDSGFLPISVWYSGGRARAPMLSPVTAESEREWAADLRRIRTLGFNAVRTWINWADAEPRPGEYRFDNLTLLARLAAQENLRVLIQVYAELTPPWLASQFPGAAFEAQSGERITSQGVPGVCPDHAGVREALLRFYRAAAEVASAIPHFHSWDLWSEPHIVNWTIVSHIPKVQYCFCPHTRARFQRWLEARYTSLDALAEAWGRRFDAWQMIEPPRFGTILTYTDFLDWKLFTFEKMAEDLQIRAEAVRSADPHHLVTSHAAVPSGLTSPLSEWGGYGCTDDFLMASAVDLYGLSLYPKHSHPQHHWERWKIDYAVEFSRSACRRHGGFSVGELQAGPGARGVVAGDPVTPEDHQRWIWTCLAQGAKAVNLYAFHPMTSGYEAGGYGLLSSDAAVTDRAGAAGRIAQTVSENMALFTSARPVPAEIAIVYNPLAQLFGGEQSCGPASLHTDSLAGYHRTFADEAIPVDFIHRRDLEEDALPEHRLLILPHPLALTSRAAHGLRRYIESGGHVLAEARLAMVDERGHMSDGIPGLGLGPVFGAMESAVRMAERPEFILTDADHLSLADLAEGTPLTGAHFAESLALRPGARASVLAVWEDGSPAIVASEFGRGATVLTGTFFGLAQRTHPTVEKRQFLLNLLRWAGVQSRIRVETDEPGEPPPTVRLQQLPDASLLVFVIAWGSPASARVFLRGFRPGETLEIHDLVSGHRERQPADGAGVLGLSPPRQSAAAVHHVAAVP